MRQNKFLTVFFILMVLAILPRNTFAQVVNQNNAKEIHSEQKKNAEKYRITFIELGSLRCIPCREMQSVMKSIEKKYGNQVKVVFYDVWTPEGKPFAEKYDIDQIPTQVFLNEKGVEFSRHTGFFPEEELIFFLKSNGVK